MVTIERMEDFTRLSLVIPDDAVASVRVGTQVRINGSPLLVASVNHREGGTIVASFGIAQSSPLTNTLKTLYPDATVQFEVDGMPVGHADVMDSLARKNSRESMENLPGTREWYSNTLPWYSKMYPDANSAPVTDRGRERYMEQNGSGSTATHGHGHDAAPMDSYFPPAASPQSPPRGTDHSSQEERLMAEWSRQAEDARRERVETSSYEDDDDYGAVTPDQVETLETGLTPTGGAGGWGISPNQFMGALEKMAERNNMLSERVERLFHELVDLEREEQETRLASVAADDPQVADEVAFQGAAG